MTRIACENDFDFVKNAWTVCFDDTPEFVDWNFRFNYSSENTIISEDNGHPTSALQLMPYKLNVAGKSVDTRYVSGVCTLPEYRGRGLVRNLFEFALPKMYDMGADISILVPAVEGMYEKFGYRKILTRQIYTVDAVKGAKEINAYSDELISLLDRVYRKEMAARPIYVDRCKFDWERILTDLLKLSGGSVFIAERGGEAVGYALAYPKDGRLEVSEICGEIEIDVKIVSAPPIMARITNAQKFIGNTKLLSDISICIKDEFIPQNNISVNGGEKEVDIAKLTEMAFEMMSKNKDEGYVNLLL